MEVPVLIAYNHIEYFASEFSSDWTQIINAETDFEFTESDTNEFEVSEFVAYGDDGIARTIIKTVSIRYINTKKGVERVPSQIKFFTAKGKQVYEVAPGVFKLTKRGVTITLTREGHSNGTDD